MTNKQIILPIVLIFAVLFLIACNDDNHLSPAYPTPTEKKISITNVSRHDPDSYVFSVEGTSKNLPDNPNFWVLVLNENSQNVYYPVVSPLTIFEDGSWKTTVYLGNETDKPKGNKYSVLPVIADDNSQKILSAYADKVDKTKNYTGIAVKDIASGLIFYPSAEVPLE